MIDVFAYLVCKKPHIKDSFNSYMYKAARNRALSFLRKSKRIVFLADEKIDFCIEDRIHIKERDERLYGCMDELFCALRFIRRIRETMTVTKPAENSGSGEYAEGETVTIDAGERSGYTFDGRTADKSVSFENEKSAVTTFMMINEDVAWNENV